jgi:xylulokinase
MSQGPERVAGLAVSAQAPTLLALDRSGKPLRPAMIWMDRRAENEVKTMERQLSAERIFQICGNRPDAFYVAPKLLWFKTYEPDRMAHTHQFVQITGYINYRLTGLLSLDHAHAALLQLRNYHSGQWSPELCEACGVIPEQFPPVLPGHQVLGGITEQAANETGLLPDTPVMVGTVDGAAAALEAGVVESGIAAEMTGTSTVLIMPNSTGITEPAFIAMPHAIPDIHLLLGAMVASGASLRWFRDQFGAVEVQTSILAGRDAFDLLTEQAAQIRPGSDGVIFLPYMMGERSPLWHTNARGVLFGLSLSTTKVAVTRAILEGTAFALRHNVEVATRAGIKLTEVRSVGGGTRSALWNQIKADVLGLPISLPEASVGAPFGDALLAGIGLGIYPDILGAAREKVRIKTRYEPDQRTHELYREFYGVFRSIYEHLRGDFDQAATFRSGKD